MLIRANTDANRMIKLFQSGTENRQKLAHAVEDLHTAIVSIRDTYKLPAPSWAMSIWVIELTISITMAANTVHILIYVQYLNSIVPMITHIPFVIDDLDHTKIAELSQLCALSLNYFDKLSFFG